MNDGNILEGKIASYTAFICHVYGLLDLRLITLSASKTTDHVPPFFCCRLHPSPDVLETICL